MKGRFSKNNIQLPSKNIHENQDSLDDLQGFQESKEKEEIKEFRIKRIDLKENNKKNSFVESSSLKNNKRAELQYVKPFTIKKVEKSSTKILSNHKIGSNISEFQTENTLKSKSQSKQSFISQRLANIKGEYMNQKITINKKPSITFIQQRLDLDGQN